MNCTCINYDWRIFFSYYGVVILGVIIYWITTERSHREKMEQTKEGNDENN